MSECWDVRYLVARETKPGELTTRPDQIMEFQGAPPQPLLSRATMMARLSEINAEVWQSTYLHWPRADPADIPARVNCLGCGAPYRGRRACDYCGRVR
jgi:hypothetical protein